MITIVSATPEMVRDYCSGPFTTQALAVVDGDNILAVYGVYLQDGCQVVFSNISDELKKKPKYIIRAWRQLLSQMETRRLPILARCDMNLHKADLFLLHLGFSPFNGNIWKMEGAR